MLRDRDVGQGQIPDLASSAFAAFRAASGDLKMGLCCDQDDCEDFRSRCSPRQICSGNSGSAYIVPGMLYSKACGRDFSVSRVAATCELPTVNMMQCEPRGTNFGPLSPLFRALNIVYASLPNSEQPIT